MFPGKSGHVTTYQSAASMGKRKIESSTNRFAQLVFHTRTYTTRAERRNKRVVYVCEYAWVYEATYRTGQAMGMTLSQALLILLNELWHRWLLEWQIRILLRSNIIFSFSFFLLYIIFYTRYFHNCTIYIYICVCKDIIKYYNIQRVNIINYSSY